MENKLEDILLSIIIPFYKGEAYLEKLLSSLITTICIRDIEIIIVDDGSPDDGTKGIYLKNIENMDSRIHILHKNNGGIFDARNFGVRYAKGEYVAFCDQDDLINAEMYSYLIDKIKETGADLAVSNFYVVKNGKKRINNEILIEQCIEGVPLLELRKWLVMGEVMNYSGTVIPSVIWNCVFKRRIIEQNRIKFQACVSYDDDWNFLLKYLEVSNKAFLSARAYYSWIVHENSESHSKKYLTNIIERYEKLYDFKLDYIGRIVISQKELELFNEYFWANALYIFCKNESIMIRSIVSYFQVVSSINNWIEDKKLIYNEKGRNFLLRKKGKFASLVYWLALHRCVGLAVLCCKLK